MARRRTHPKAEFARYLRTETTGGIVLLIGTAIALIWVNSAFGDSYVALRDAKIGPDLLHLNLSVGTWAKDGLLALFFFVVGLELKRELVVGELSNIKAAALPIVAAIGGMVIPAIIALAISWGEPGYERAWAIPMATDIAFALGVLALTARHLPSSARIFLLSLAVVDDLGAIIVIAVLFTSGFDLVAAGVALVALAVYWLLQKKRVRTAWLYVPLAVVVWIAIHTTGIHATIAGVALGLLTRVRADPGEEEAPAIRLEHRLQPYSALIAVPVFALFAAGVPINAEAMTTVFTSKIPLAVMAGLIGGKLIGIVGASAIAVRLGIGRLPSRTNWRDITALAMLGAVGFTVSLLIADLGLPEEAREPAKSAVLIASATASLLAAALLSKRSKAHAQYNNAQEA
ncbi:Na+/H+ antiporter NhaA [Haloechinothrix halophila]|uniref:Na+/H+ antiporter NhaA n=1 Tax=Haloechinothrix halophila TaxID=1069073 RepID=UPI00041738F4|nr:Na+/H+ antiporter NhaA [Haloechinothrix halophila]